MSNLVIHKMWTSNSCRFLLSSLGPLRIASFQPNEFRLICANLTMEAIEIQKTTAWLQRNWDLKTAGVDSVELLLAALATQLRVMLNDNFEGLVQTMYRLDVAEKKFQAAIQLGNVADQAEALAKVVFERELQRLATWEKYSKPNK